MLVALNKNPLRSVKSITRLGILLITAIFLISVPLFFAIPDVDRSFFCDDCQAGYIPPETHVQITLRSNANVVDYFPSNWAVVDASGGFVFSTSLTNYRKIEWPQGVERM